MILFIVTTQPPHFWITLKAFDSAQAEGWLHAERSRSMNLTISKGG